jgi:hypothetical protein
MPMAEPSLTRCALLLFAGFYAAPLFALAAVAILARVTVALNDASSAILIFLSTVLFLTFAIQSGLLLRPAF